MKDFLTWISAVFAAVAIWQLATEGRADNLSIAGTLTCTTSAPGQGRVDARLSCHFDTKAGGPGRNYTGFIARKGPPDIPDGKRVLIWTVLAEVAKDADSLEGVYQGTTGGAPGGVLIGGKSRSIRLEPVSSASQVGESPASTVVELRLEPIKI